MIKAVLFDVDGVLLDSFEANLVFFQNLMKRAGHRPPTREEYAKLFHLHMRGVIKTLTDSLPDEEIDKIWEMGNSREVPYPVELLSIPEHAEEVIKTLNKDYQLGIVTSRQKNGIFESPKLTKLEKYFTIVVSYEDTTQHKPNPEPLTFAYQKLQIHASDSVYIGDSESDLIAAKSAGGKIVMYSEKKFPDADAQTTTFYQLPEIIKILG